jgi:hypothetical protein
MRLAARLCRLMHQPLPVVMDMTVPELVMWLRAAEVGA